MLRNPSHLAWLVVGLALVTCGRSPVDREAPRPGRAGRSSGEAIFARRFEEVRDDPAALHALLHAMPKGGDLHTHLYGSIPAETILRWASADGACIERASLRALPAPECAARSAEVAPVPASGELYERIVRAWSMEGFEPAGSRAEREHFRAAFDGFGAVVGRHRDDALAELARAAAAENVAYVETALNLARQVGELAASLAIEPDEREDLEALYRRLVSHPDFEARLAEDLRTIEAARAGHRRVLGCDRPGAEPACAVELRFLAQVSRTGPAARVLGQLVGAFELAARTRWLVGATLSSPEEDPRAVAAFGLQMTMLELLHERYVETGRSPLRLALHAGELSPDDLAGSGAGLRDHVRDAIERGHASRIGHGVDVLAETGAEGLLASMRERGVLVEVCLGSNAFVLGVRGPAHPLRAYLAHGVPVALATDDRGVMRGSLTDELSRAVREHGLGARELVALARSSLEHAFVPGPSLWRSIERAEPIEACTPLVPASERCRAWLATSERGALQWELERRLVELRRAAP